MGFSLINQPFGGYPPWLWNGQGLIFRKSHGMIIPNGQRVMWSYPKQTIFSEKMKSFWKCIISVMYHIDISETNHSDIQTLIISMVKIHDTSVISIFYIQICFPSIILSTQYIGNIISTWRFLEMGVPPVIIHLNEIFPCKPSSDRGVPPMAYGNPWSPIANHHKPSLTICGSQGSKFTTKYFRG